MSQHDLIRRRLIARRDELARRANMTDADLRHERDPLSVDSEEQVTQRENEDVLRGIGLAARASLGDVNRALERLERGEYFDCESCGKPIGAARLEALPEAVRCTDCARNL